MAAHTFQLIIRTPEQEIFAGQVNSVTVSTEELGIMQVLPGHASLTGVILFSPIIVKMPDQEEDFLARRGIILVSNEHRTTTILVTSCEKRKEISYQSAREYLDFIEKKLKEGADLSHYQLTHLQKEKVTLEYTLKALKSKS